MENADDSAKLVLPNFSTFWNLFCPGKVLESLAKSVFHVLPPVKAFANLMFEFWNFDKMDDTSVQYTTPMRVPLESTYIVSSLCMIQYNTRKLQEFLRSVKNVCSVNGE